MTPTPKETDIRKATSRRKWQMIPQVSGFATIREENWGMVIPITARLSTEQAALIVQAVNLLPHYEAVAKAAEESLMELLDRCTIHESSPTATRLSEALAALNNARKK